MIVEFLSQAKSELFDAAEYYEGELSGLGQRLWDEVDLHIAGDRLTARCSWVSMNHLEISLTRAAVPL